MKKRDKPVRGITIHAPLERTEAMVEDALIATLPTDQYAFRVEQSEGVVCVNYFHGGFKRFHRGYPSQITRRDLQCTGRVIDLLAEFYLMNDWAQSQSTPEYKEFTTIVLKALEGMEEDQLNCLCRICLLPADTGSTVTIEFV